MSDGVRSRLGAGDASVYWRTCVSQALVDAAVSRHPNLAHCGVSARRLRGGRARDQGADDRASARFGMVVNGAASYQRGVAAGGDALVCDQVPDQNDDEVAP